MKIKNAVLKRSVLKLIKNGPVIGQDCAQINVGGQSVLTASSAMVTNSITDVLTCFYKAVNNIYAAGGTVDYIEQCFVLRENFDEQYLKLMTRTICNAAEQAGIKVCGGHTSVAEGQSEDFISFTAIGSAGRADIDLKNAKAGDSIVASKWIGTTKIAQLISNEDNRTKLYSRLNSNYLGITNSYIEWLSVESEAAVAVKHGVKAMHDVSDGGIFASLWELTEGARRGFEIDLRAIPVRQETIECCHILDINPYTSDSTGMLLMVTEDGEGLVKELELAGIPSAIIGHMADNSDKIIKNDDEIRYLDRY